MQIINDVAHAARQGEPFQIRYAYTGINHNNVSGWSDKYWCIERPEANGPIQIRFGRTGTKGQTRNRGISLNEALAKAGDKTAKGYRFVSAKVLTTDTAQRDTRPPLREWARGLPTPFNSIVAVAPSGEATDANGNVVCRLPATQAESLIRDYAPAD